MNLLRWFADCRTRLNFWRARYGWPRRWREWVVILFPRLKRRLWPRWLEPASPVDDRTPEAFEYWCAMAHKVESHRHKWTYNKEVREECTMKRFRQHSDS